MQWLRETVPSYSEVRPSTTTTAPLDVYIAGMASGLVPAVSGLGHRQILTARETVVDCGRNGTLSRPCRTKGIPKRLLGTQTCRERVRPRTTWGRESFR